jgi:hypothetical protein
MARKKKKKFDFKINRTYKTKDHEIFDVAIDFKISFKEMYESGLAPDDVIWEIIQETDKTAKEIYNADPID